MIKATLALDIPIHRYRTGERQYFLMTAIRKGDCTVYTKEVALICQVHESNLFDTSRLNTDVAKLLEIQGALPEVVRHQGIHATQGDSA